MATTAEKRSKAKSSKSVTGTDPEAVSTHFDKELFQEALTWGEFDILNVAADLAFSGFNPVITFNIVVKLIKDEKVEVSHLQTLLVFGLTRGFGGGKDLGRILNRTVSQGRDRLKKAVEAFKIQLGNPKDYKTLTIPRIMAAFPFLTYKIHSELVVRGAHRIMPGYTGNLPAIWQYPGSPAMMTEEEWVSQKDNYVGWSVHCSNVWKNPQDEDTALKFAELAYTSAVSPMEERESK